jgi:thiol-disulfide isomerase/thioredoxin
MGKAERNRLQNAREKIAAQQAAAKRAETRRRALIAGGSVLAVLLIVVVLVIVKTSGGRPAGKSSSAATASANTPVATSVSQKIASVPAATLDKIGAGVAYPAPGGIYPNAIQTVKSPPAILKSNGKPQVVYVGADYCPYCAAERWALTVALSRFGTFSNLSLIHSSSTDVYPNTPTLSFYKSSYTSKYVVFSTTEAQTVTHATLQPLTALDKTLMATYDAPPYVPAGYNGSFPFVDFGNQYVIDGASYNPQTLAKLTWQQVAADLSNPNSAVAKAIDGTANHITAAICKITGNQPGNVCTSPGVTAAAGSI